METIVTLEWNGKRWASWTQASLKPPGRLKMDWEWVGRGKKRDTEQPKRDLDGNQAFL